VPWIELSLCKVLNDLVENVWNVSVPHDISTNYGYSFHVEQELIKSLHSGNGPFSFMPLRCHDLVGFVGVGIIVSKRFVYHVRISGEKVEYFPRLKPKHLIT